MSFLKAFGQISVQVLKTVLGLAPMIQALTPAGSTAATVENEFFQFSDAILKVEQAAEAFATSTGAPMTGAQKFAMARVIIQNILLQSPIVKMMKIKNPDQLNAAIDGYTQATVNLWNAFHEDSVQTVIAGA